MPLKKKVPAAKPTQGPAFKRMAMQEIVNPKTRKDNKNSLAANEVASHSAGAVAQPARSPDQLEVFDSAIKLFHARNFKEARERFLVSMRGANRGISHKSE